MTVHPDARKENARRIFLPSGHEAARQRFHMGGWRSFSPYAWNIPVTIGCETMDCP